MKSTSTLDARLRSTLLLRHAEGDRLMLADAVLIAALDGNRPLTAGERAALAQSPLTLRRFRHLASQRKGAAQPAWRGSAGMLRAAAGGELTTLCTDDNCWSLHFVPHDDTCQVILKLAADAPFAPRLMREQPMLCVLDGGGAIILHGRLDADGECESNWPFSSAPAAHFQQFGARFSVEPVQA